MGYRIFFFLIIDQKGIELGYQTICQSPRRFCHLEALSNPVSVKIMGNKMVSVVGAMGSQGSSVVETLLKEGEYSIRAIIRNPGSENAKSWAARGVEVVKPPYFPQD